MSAANSVFPGATGPEQPADQGPDPVLAAAGELARQAAAEEAGAEYVGEHAGVQPEPSGAATHLFDSQLPGYRGWRWAVTVANAGPDAEVTVSEVVLLPGPDALVAPAWVPWQQRVRAGDLGVGDLMPPVQDDPRLAAAYLQSDDPEVEEVATELGLGRVHVLSRLGRLEAAERWQEGEFGPGSDMARSAPEHCGNCGFYLQLAGSLRAAFGVCGNEISPADGRVVHAEYGCGAHSEIEVSLGSPVPVADLVYDDTVLDMEPVDTTSPEAEVAVDEPAAEGAVAGAEPEAASVESEAEAAAPVAPEVAVESEAAVVESDDESVAAPESAVAEAEPAAREPEVAVAAESPAEPVAAVTEPADPETAPPAGPEAVVDDPAGPAAEASEAGPEAGRPVGEPITEPIVLPWISGRCADQPEAEGQS
jgi:DUF3027 family protein